MNDPHSFGRRLRRIQGIPSREKRLRTLGRLLRLFQAETVRTSAGTVAGYRLPTGEWFCRKIVYHSEVEAKIAAADMRRRHRGLCSPYRCHQCGHIHLTSAPKTKKNS